VIDSLDHLSESQPKSSVTAGPERPRTRLVRYRAASLSEIDEALEFASAGFATWHRLTVAERQATLRRAADLMSERRENTIAVMARDGARPSPRPIPRSVRPSISPGTTPHALEATTTRARWA